MIHLTHTGQFAGVILCGGDKSGADEYVHAVYAPLRDETYRSKVCPECLTVYAVDAYGDGDDIPEWARLLRESAP